MGQWVLISEGPYKFALWLALITSGEFGFERDVIEKAALDRMPLPDFRKLPPETLKEVDQLFNELHVSAGNWDKVDHWVADLYGLGTTDLQIIADTLAFNLPFAETKIAAQARPDPKTTADFCTLLQDELEPWAKRFNTHVNVRMVPDRPTSPWLGLLLHTGCTEPDNNAGADWQGLLAVADATAAAEMIVEGQNGALLIGRLAQRRYWSDTQARLLAQHIVWSRLDFLRGLKRK